MVKVKTGMLIGICINNLKIKPALSSGIEYWWSDANKAQKVAKYLHQQ